MFRENNSLVGIHNITEANLRKALKAGGLTNPSVAVVDISQRGHDQFGAISLILPSYMIDKTSGYNAGTWTDDVWTPIYPPTRTIFTEQGYKNFVDAINKYGSSKSFNKFYAENERDQAYQGNNPNLVHYIVDGKLYRVKASVKEYLDSNVKNKPYAYEVIKIELIDDSFVNTNGTNKPLNQTDSPISIAKNIKRS